MRYQAFHSWLSLRGMVPTIVCFLLLFTSLLSLSPAALINVPADYPTMQQAIDAAGHGDEIVVAPGTYVAHIDFKGKNLILRSTEPTNPSVVASTIIDGNHNGTVVLFAGSENDSCFLSGFTIRNGYAPYGGGIDGNGTLATIQHNTITANAVHGDWPDGPGGGVFHCFGTIQNNLITDNSATYGGGLAWCQGTIQTNTISANYADWEGGGLWDCNGIIWNNTFSANSAQYFGGGLLGADGTVENNSITGNSAWSGGGLMSCENVVHYNTISDNSASFGGGLCGCDGIIQHNIITTNRATAGGGLAWCMATIQRNLISANSAQAEGGGLLGCTGTTQNNTIAANVAVDGGGLYSCDGTVQNNLIHHNTAQCGGGLAWCDRIILNNVIMANSAQMYGGGLCNCRAVVANCIIINNQNWGIYEESWYCSPQQMKYCDVYENGTADYYDFETASSYTSATINNLPEVYDCLSIDPRFVAPSTQDYHLQEDSPCIDAGDPDPQFRDACRPPGLGSRLNDMGAYGGLHNCAWLDLVIQQWFFEGPSKYWEYKTVSPSAAHSEHWEHASPISLDPHAISLVTPYDETTNYFALWDSYDAMPIPYSDNSLYRADWIFSSNRQTANTVPSVRFHMVLKNQKAFSFSRIFPGDWLPMSPRPAASPFLLFFEPPLASPDGLFLAFSVVDWMDDFRHSSPAGIVNLEEVSVYRYDLGGFSDWREETILHEFSAWTSNTVPFYFAPEFAHTEGELSLASGIHESLVFGTWDSPEGLFSITPDNLYRVTLNLASDPQLGGPDLRLRVHTDDFRYSWYSYYVSSYTPGESALPPVEGADYHLFLTFPFLPQSCRASVDLIDFSPYLGGTHTIRDISLQSQIF